MAYEAVYRNNYPVQFGTVILTLYLTDSNGVMPDVRVDCKLRYPEQCTEESLVTLAQQRIDSAIVEFEQSLLPTEASEPIP